MRRRGFTLLECVIATFVVMAGFLAVVSVFSMGRRAAAADRNHALGLQVAANVLARIRAHPYGSPLAPGVLGDVTVRDEVEGVPVDVTFAVSATFASGGCVGMSQQGTDVATVTVRWRDGTGAGGAGRTREVSLAGGVTDEP